MSWNLEGLSMVNETRSLVYGLLAISLLACSKDNSIDATQNVTPGIGLQCTGAGDPACGTTGVCALGYCRIGCGTDAECPQGALCIGDVYPYGCQLPQDAECNDTDKKCSAPLVCGLDRTCRMGCVVSGDCPRNEHVCRAGVCVGESEKGEAAVAYLSCEDGERRCGTTGATCTSGVCEVQVCNVLAPGWAVEQECQGNQGFCQAGVCLGVEPEDPGVMVQVPSPLGGTYGIDATEVTRAQYLKFVQEKEGDVAGQPSYCSWNATYLPKDPIEFGGVDWPPLDRPDHPVMGVDWCDAYAFCAWAGKRLCGRIGGGASSYEDYANASTSQWFNACASGGQNTYPYGSTYEGQTCNGADNGVGTTVAVGSLTTCQSSVSGYAGVYDLSGNAMEWEDACDGDVCRVRGGRFNNGGSDIGCAYDSPSDRMASLEVVGFRCCSP
jgi:hypothetical protein